MALSITTAQWQVRSGDQSAYISKLKQHADNITHQWLTTFRILTIKIKHIVYSKHTWKLPRFIWLSSICNKWIKDLFLAISVSQSTLISCIDTLRPSHSFAYLNSCVICIFITLSLVLAPYIAMPREWIGLPVYTFSSLHCKWCPSHGLLVAFIGYWGFRRQVQGPSLHTAWSLDCRSVPLQSVTLAQQTFTH